MAVERVGVVGAGTMGAGIAQVALEAGHPVALYDIDFAAFQRASARIADGLARRAARRGLDGDAGTAWIGERMARLDHASRLEAVAADAALVIEAAVEDLALKRVLFTALSAAAPATTILATNTSALPVASLAEDCVGRERILGLHFFNPAPVMALVEVVIAPGTAPDVADRAEAMVVRWGKTTVRCTDAPGFIVNRVNRPFTLEPLRMLAAGAGTIESIDAAIRAAGFAQGPFEHIDLVGLDVNLATTTSLHAALGRPDRLEPSALQARLVAARRLGRKTGVGFYEYGRDGRLVRPGPGFTRRGGRIAALAPEAIAERVLLAVANEAYYAIEDGVADADRIDLALRLGAGYPVGPVAWARARGLKRVRDELGDLRAAEGDRFAVAGALLEDAAR